MKPLALSLVVLLTACGSGGGEDPTPAAASAVAPRSETTTHVDPPPATDPAPLPAATQPPVAPAPGAAPGRTARPAPATPAPVLDTVPGAIAEQAVLREWQPFPPVEANLGRLNATAAYYYQQLRTTDRDPTGPMGLVAASESWEGPTTGSLYLPRFSVSVPVLRGADGRLALDSQLTATVAGVPTPLGSVGAPFAFDPAQTYPLDQAAITWRHADGRYVQLLLQSDQDPAVFRACWHAQLEVIKRVMCGRFLRASGSFVGVRIGDDSYGEGERVWQ